MTVPLWLAPPKVPVLLGKVPLASLDKLPLVEVPDGLVPPGESPWQLEDLVGVLKDRAELVDREQLSADRELLDEVEVAVVLAELLVSSDKQPLQELPPLASLPRLSASTTSQSKSYTSTLPRSKSLLLAHWFAEDCTVRFGSVH